jgi:hypothetical protein
MSTRHDDYSAYEKYEPAHLALFGGVAIALLVFAWTFGAFVR